MAGGGGAGDWLAELRRAVPVALLDQVQGVGETVDGDAVPGAEQINKLRSILDPRR